MPPVGFMLSQSQEIIYINYICIAEGVSLTYNNILILEKEKSPKLKWWESSEKDYAQAKEWKY